MKLRSKTAGSLPELMRCGLYFMGQNLFYFLVYLYMNIYFTDMGIPVLALAGIALAVQLWGLVMGPFFGRWVMQLRRSRWARLLLRLCALAVPLSTIFLFSIPFWLPLWSKILWAGLGYLIWDFSFAVCGAPSFGMEDCLTELSHGHTALNPIGRGCAMAATAVLLVVIPSFRGRLGGWSKSVTCIALLGFLFLLPSTLHRSQLPNSSEPIQSIGIREILHYLRGNRYLTIYYLAFLVISITKLSSWGGLYMARHCLGRESMFSVTGILCMIPAIGIGILLPSITPRCDKFRLFYTAVVLALAMQLVRYYVGYRNQTAYVLAAVAASIPTAVLNSILFRLTADCIEYGRYIGQQSVPGLPLAIQIFFVKLQTTAVTVSGALMLHYLGFVEGEGAFQATGFARRLWKAGILIPAAGLLVGLLILSCYKLRDHDVAIMSMCNEGRLSRADAQRQLCRRTSKR